MKPFNKILGFNLLIALVVGVLALLGAGFAPRKGDLNLMGAMAGLILMGIQALVCWITGVVFLFKNRTSEGLGFLLSGFLLPVLGFGTCSLSLFLLQ
ncbi:MAG: hypothetical protein U1F66_10815 [bacterium]